ncbi:glycosyltransferase [Candidatus Micrarchaeota archaeon]|nr:glycosyltransferase [Candidatus Micrarchaeota archaeon]
MKKLIIDFAMFPRPKECGTMKIFNGVHKELKNEIDAKIIVNEKIDSFQKKIFSILSVFSYKFAYKLFSDEVKKKHRKKILHLISQEEAFILNYINCKSIVSVLDFIGIKELPEKRKKLVLDGLKKADKIIAISNYTKEQINKFLEYPKEKIKLVYPSIDAKVFFPRKNKKILKNHSIPENFVLCVGSEIPRKNLGLLIKAVAKLGLNLVHISGFRDKKEKEKNRKLIKELKMEEKVFFIDNIIEETLAEFYSLADLFAFPSTEEGFGLPVLEAMACGCPVVCSNAASLPEAAGNAALIFESNNLNDLIKKIETVLSNKKARKELIEKGLSRAKEFNPKTSAQKTLKIYIELANEKHSYFDEKYALEHEKQKPENYWEFKVLLDLYKPKETDECIDLGCNTGEFSYLLQKKFNCKVKGIDVNENAVNSAKKKYSKVDFEKKDVFEEKRKYNAVYALHLIEHIEDTQEFLQKTKDLLKGNGKLVLCCPNKWAYYHKFLSRIRGEKFCFDPTHLHEFSPENLIKELTRADFKIKKLTTRQFTFPLLQYLFKNTLFGAHIFVLAEKQ